MCVVSAVCECDVRAWGVCVCGVSGECVWILLDMSCRLVGECWLSVSVSSEYI